MTNTHSDHQAGAEAGQRMNQVLQAERDAMNVEWGQLQLEQSTHTTHGKVEIAAHERLDMAIPGPQRVVILRP